MNVAKRRNVKEEKYLTGIPTVADINKQNIATLKSTAE
jgi:hypothetical protein